MTCCRPRSGTEEQLVTLYSLTSYAPQQKTQQASRDSAHRKALFANLIKETIDHERIKTTEAKAKAVKPELEKMITLAKRGDRMHVVRH